MLVVSIQSSSTLTVIVALSYSTLLLIILNRLNVNTTLFEGRLMCGIAPLQIQQQRYRYWCALIVNGGLGQGGAKKLR
jgi:hypothetical protein